MKKTKMIFALFLAIMMMLTACGNQNQSLDGKWVGYLDVTKQFEDGVKKANPKLEKFVDFEDLVFVLDISFVDGQMSMSVRQESIDAFNKNFAEGMKELAEEYWEAGLAQYDMTIEEERYESGLSEEDYLNQIYQSTGIDQMITSMTDVTNKTLDKLSNMKGLYTTPVNNELRLYYTEDNQEYESMQYKFKGKKLNITIKGEGFSLLIECERNK